MKLQELKKKKGKLGGDNGQRKHHERIHLPRSGIAGVGLENARCTYLAAKFLEFS